MPQGYLLVLLDCDISLLGLAWLMLLAVCLVIQPPRGRWQAAGDDTNGSSALHAALEGALPPPGEQEGAWGLQDGTRR